MRICAALWQRRFLLSHPAREEFTSSVTTDYVMTNVIWNTWQISPIWNWRWIVLISRRFVTKTPISATSWHASVTFLRLRNCNCHLCKASWHRACRNARDSLLKWKRIHQLSLVTPIVQPRQILRLARAALCFTWEETNPRTTGGFLFLEIMLQKEPILQEEVDMELGRIPIVSSNSRSFVFIFKGVFDD